MTQDTENNVTVGETGRPRLPLLVVSVVAVLGLALIGAVTLGVRTTPELPDSMSGVRSIPGTDKVIELAGLGLIAVDLPSIPGRATPPLPLNSSDRVLHFSLASPEWLLENSLGATDLSEATDAAVSRAALDGVGELRLAVELAEILDDRDPPVRLYVAYSATKEVACFVQIKDDSEPLVVAAPVFRAIRPAREGESDSE